MLTLPTESRPPPADVGCPGPTLQEQSVTARSGTWDASSRSRPWWGKGLVVPRHRAGPTAPSGGWATLNPENPLRPAAAPAVPRDAGIPGQRGLAVKEAGQAWEVKGSTRRRVGGGGW